MIPALDIAKHIVKKCNEESYPIPISLIKKDKYGISI